MGTLNLNTLQGILPPNVISEIPVVTSRFGMNNSLRLGHFLAQCSHESGRFRFIQENLNYSAEALLRVFPKYFTPEQAQQYARQPDKIGSRVYGGRMGNGPEASGEGFRYRGRGYIQLTGKNNYAAFSQFMGEDFLTYPDLIAIKYPLVSAAWFFHVNNLNQIADRGANLETITQITRRVNGGLNGLNDRIEEFNRIYPILNR